MKRKITIIIFLFSCFWIQSYAQQEGKLYDNKEGSSMIPVIYELDTLVNIIEKNFTAEIVRMEFDIIRDTAFSFRNLFPGYRYGIFVYGDYRIKEINVDIYKKEENNWTIINSGTIDNNTALAWIEPEGPGFYSFRIYVKEFYENYIGGHYGILIFH